MILIHEAKIPIIIPSRSLKSTFSIAGMLLIIALLFISSKIWPLWVFITLFILLVVFRIGLYLLKSYRIIGSIILKRDEIIIKELEGTNAFKMQEVRLMEITFTKVGGDFSRKGFFPSEGNDNYLQFEYGGQLRKYEILLERENLIYLNAFFEEWKNLQFDVYIWGRYGKRLYHLS